MGKIQTAIPLWQAIWMIGIRIMTRWHSFNQRNYNLSKLRVNIEVCSEGNTTRIAAPRNHNMFRKHGDAGRYIFIWRAVINRDDFYYLVKHADNTCGCNSVQSLSTVFFFRAVSHYLRIYYVAQKYEGRAVSFNIHPCSVPLQETIRIIDVDTCITHSWVLSNFIWCDKKTLFKQL